MKKEIHTLNIEDFSFFIPSIELMIDQECDGDGASGLYYQISNSVGIKVIITDSFKKLKDLKQSITWKKAKNEFENIKKAHKILGTHAPGAIKLTYAIQIIEGAKHYHPAIIMDHLDLNEEFDESKNYELLGKTFRGAVGLSRRLVDLGIYHQDIHSGNIMILNNKVQIIDFEYSQFKY